ncbi:hypothetical protein RKD45_002265 [Streptomyces griseus]
MTARHERSYPGMEPISSSAPSLGEALMNCLKSITADPAVFPQQAKTCT